MTSISEEDIAWNDYYFLRILSNNDTVRLEANSKLLNRIENDPNYIINLFEYCILRINCSSSKQSLIYISKIVETQPNYFIINYLEIKPRLISLINAIKGITRLYEQRFLGHIINTSVDVLVNSINNQEELGEKLDFFENLFITCQNDLETNPLCFYSIQSVKHFHHVNNAIIIMILYRLIVEYYPKTYDFDLLRDCIYYFCHYDGLLNAFVDNYEHIISFILQFAQTSNILEPNQFDAFWCSIQELNINESSPFYDLAINFLQSCQNIDSRMILINFIDEHATLILPNQVEFLFYSLYDTVSQKEDINLSDFSLISKFSIVDFDTFTFAFNFSRQLLIKNNYKDDLIYILINWCLLEQYQLQITFVISEIVQNFMKLLIKYLDNSFVQQIILLFLSNAINIYPDNEKVKEIPQSLIHQATLYQEKSFVESILYTLTSGVPLIDLKSFFNDLLKLFCSQVSIIKPKTASCYFLALSTYLPIGRLFPEDKYKSIYELIQQFLPFFNTTKSIRFTLSVFIFKMYIIDQELIKDILIPAIRNFCFAINCDLKSDILLQMSSCLVKFIKLFKKQAFLILRENNFYHELYTAIFNQKTNFSVHPYLIILYYIYKYDRANFNEHNYFIHNILNAFYEGKGKDMTIIIKIIPKLLYKISDLSIIEEIVKHIEDKLYISISKMNTAQLIDMIDICSSFIKPSHVSKRSNIFKDNYSELITRVVELLSNSANKLILLSSEKKNNFRIFYEPIAQIFLSLCSYNSPIIHTFFNFLYQSFNLQQESNSLQNMIAEFDMFLDIGNSMMDSKIIQAEEIQMMVSLYQKILTDPELIEIYADAYISMSHLVLVEPEFIRPFIELLCQHWKTISDEYVLNILCALFLMIFSKINDSKENQTVIELVIEINDRFTPTIENCNYFIEASLEFLNNYPNIPLAVKERFFHSYVIYISYQKYASNIFKVKQNNHDKLIDKIRELIQEIPTWKEIFESCFPGSPRALRGSLEMIGIPIETNPNPDQKI